MQDKLDVLQLTPFKQPCYWL